MQSFQKTATQSLQSIQKAAVHSLRTLQETTAQSFPGMTILNKKNAKLKLSPYGWGAISIAILFTVIGARWIWLYRGGQAVDIDEAGYLSIALSNYAAWVRGGALGWLGAILGPDSQAPLTTDLASLVFMVTGPNLLAGFFVPLVLATFCILATYSMGAAVGSRLVGLCASLVVASCPVMSFYSRSFHFGTASALTTTAALLFMLLSNRFEKRREVILFGLFLGLMPLARSIDIAFMPGVMMAALFYILADPADPAKLRKRLVAFAGALALAGLVAASWLVVSGKYVFTYLFSFGYGARAAEYGAKQSLFSLDAWLATLQLLANRDANFPHLVLILLGCLAILIVAVLTVRKSGIREGVRAIARSPITPLCLATAEFVVALTSSQNKGSAFFAPVLPILLVVSVWGLFKLNFGSVYRASLVAALAALAVLAGLPDVDLHSPFSKSWEATVPIIGGVTLTDGRGTLQSYASAYHFGPSDISQPLSSSQGEAWLSFNNSLSAAITKAYGLQPVVLLGFRNALLNINTVNLAHLVASGFTFSPVQIEPTVTGTSQSDFVQWLNARPPQACGLVTSNLANGEFPPEVDGLVMEAAARQAGFTPTLQLTAPDGRPVTIWSPPTAPPNCHGA